MAKQHIQPPEIFDSANFGYTQVVTATNETLVFVSGQTGLDRNFQLKGPGDLAAQAEQACENLRSALAACGGKPADVTSLRIYVVDYRPECAAMLAGPLGRFFDGAKPSAQTLLGVQALGMPELLIEIEATAAIAD
jgi:enamine deaminase RidA (YjgF/YER057c/UK114 family)